MFAVGSCVVHPCYGAGRIVRVQEKSIGDRTTAYYVIETVHRPMELMVPVHRADDVGLRTVGDANALWAEIDRHLVTPQEDDIDKDLRTRQTVMRDDLKSGDFGAVAEVVRILYYLNSMRPLGTTDRQLLDQGKELIIGELSLAAAQELNETTNKVEDLLAGMVAQE